MLKKKSHNLTSVLTIFVVLLCVFLSSIGVANAWFTELNKKGVYVVFNVSQLNLKLFQITKDEKLNDNYIEVYTNSKNTTESTEKYLQLSKEIAPDEFNELRIAVSNEDAGGAFNIRYKLEVYACGAVTDKLLISTLSVCENNVTKNDGYTYYEDGDGNTLNIPNDGSKINLFTGFTIPYASYATLYGGETIKLVLTIEVI